MMKRIALLILVLTCYSCGIEPPHNEQNYAFKIARVYLMDDALQDSVVFAYDEEQQLVQVEKFFTPTSISRYTVSYDSALIRMGDGTYYEIEEDVISKYVTGMNSSYYTFEDNRIAHEKNTVNDTIVLSQSYHYYENGNPVVDSFVNYDQADGTAYITRYENVFTDSLLPDFVRHYSGLYEMKQKSTNLVRTMEASEHDILYRNTYDIGENLFVEYSRFFDSRNDSLLSLWTTKYYYWEFD